MLQVLQCVTILGQLTDALWTRITCGSKVDVMDGAEPTDRFLTANRLS